MTSSRLGVLPDVLDRLANGYVEAINGMTGLSLVAEVREEYQQETFSAPGRMIGILDFTGSIVGFFAVSLDEQTIANALGMGELPSEDERGELRKEYESFLKEVLNSVSGDCLSLLQDEYSTITVLAPKVIYGSVCYPKIACLTRHVCTSIGSLYFTVSIDTMQLEVNRLTERLRGSEQELLISKLELERTALELRNALEAPSEAIIIHENGAIVDVNEAFSRIFGFELSEVIGRNLWEFADPQCRELVREKVSTGSEEPYEAAGLTKEGKAVPIEIRATVVPYEDRTVQAVAVRDLSEHKRVQQALRDSERQLRHAQKMEAIGRLAAGVAHDFNNLLTIITGHCDLLLLNLDKDGTPAERVQEILFAGERATSLTRQLLAFSRKQVLQPTVLKLGAVVSDLSKMLTRMIGENIDLTVVSSPNLGSVKADRGQIEQVIMNLAVNAGDAMPNGGKLTIEISNVTFDEAYIRKHRASEAGDYIMLAVTDNGVGMDERIQAQVFEPFFTTKEEGKGTGLGLSTVYGIVKQSRGYIELYSEPGHGTAFKIYLPRVDEAVERTPRGVSDTAKARGSETILLVENADGVRKLAREILHGNGYAVLEAEGGKQALLLCERYSGKIHLMVTDVVMPQMSGREVAEKIAPLRPDMKVLFMSGYADDAIVQHGVLESGEAFIQKPFSPAGLVGKVRETLDAV